MTLPTSAAPLDIGHVVLTVRDLPRMAGFYRSLLGLDTLAEGGGEVALGAGGQVLVVLRADPAARVAQPSEAGLFHTAFLMPGRSALARWLIHAASLGTALQGASDHLVSEAIYLADPEGNGIEVYADRPRDTWHDAAGKLRMATLRLDLQALARAADGPWQGAPDGLAVGHVHLQVGDVAQAAAFLAGTLGMPAMAAYPGATFHGAGGYHHHIAGNVWNSRGAGARRLPVTGLAELVLRADPATFADLIARAGGTELADPWGTAVTILPKAA